MESKTTYTCPFCSKIYQKKHYYDAHVEKHDGNVSLPKKIKKKSSSATVANAPSVISADAAAPASASTSSNAGDVMPNLDLDDGDTPFVESEGQEDNTPFFLEEEDEEEEARRLLAACSTAEAQEQAQKPKKPKKRALVKCTECKVNFFTLDGFVKHKMTHRFEEILLKIPDFSILEMEQYSIMDTTLQDVIKFQSTVGYGPQIKGACDALCNMTENDCWRDWVSSVSQALYKGLTSAKFALPSELKEKYSVSTSVYLRDLEVRHILKSKLQTIIPEFSQVFDLLIGTIVRNFSYKILAFVLRYLNQSCRQQQSQSLLSESYAVTSQRTDNLDFKQNMHYIGGSNVRSVLNRGLRLKYPKPQDTQTIAVLRERFLVGEFSDAPVDEIIAWTECQDRGGLTKINAKALDFFVALGCLIKPLEHFDGSLYVDEVVENVMQTTDVVLRWDDLIRNTISKDLSFQLLYNLCAYFTNTWREGIVGRRKDALSKETDAPKHGTQGVAFRAKLST